MLKWTKKKGSVFTLLLRNYMVFTIALVIALSSLFAFLSYQSYQDFVETDRKLIDTNSQFLIDGAYEQFPTLRLLGESGFIAILDDSSNIIYNSGDFNIELSQAELSYIPNHGSLESDSFFETITVEELSIASGGINYQILRTYQSDNTPMVKEFYILDEEYSLIYASGEYIRSDLTEKEFGLLRQNYFKDYYVSKYTFQTADNKNATLLLFQMQDSDDILYVRAKKTLLGSVILFLIIYGAMIMSFVLWLKRKITIPLHLLCSHLNNFELGTKVLHSYQGPKEFEAIFESFSTMATRFERSEAERRRLESDKQMMLAGITHDLKTPITVVQGYAKALSDGVIPLGEQQKYIDTITQKADELNQLINTFYEYSKLEHPNYEPTLERSDICNYLRDYVAEKYGELETAGFLLDVEIPEKHIYCYMDRTLLKRAFENIVANGVKHNPQGTTLYFRLSLRENNVVITLADNGIGVPSGLSKEIFSPFIMGDTSRKGAGSGLGLSITKRIVEAHRGDIILLQDTALYKTAFEITLPQS